MRNNIIVVFTLAILVSIIAFKGTIAGETTDDVKSVAWYVANLKVARIQNQQCHDNPSLLGTANCENSLHALEISFNGGN